VRGVRSKMRGLVGLSVCWRGCGGSLLFSGIRCDAWLRGQYYLVFLAVVVLVENGGFLLLRFEVGFGPIRGGGGLTVPYIGILSILYEV
jgi:hypothetical protein